MKQVVGSIKQNIMNKVRDYTNPFNLMIPWLNAIFKKYMGNYFNEEFHKEQFTSMGLKQLTLKVATFNQQLSPNFPFKIEKGSIGLLKLDLRSLTLLVEDLEIHVTLKTLGQYHEYAQGYQKAKLTADKIQKFKQEILQKLRIKQQENNNYSAWNIIRQFMQKITLTVNHLVVHINVDQKLSLAINNISLRVRKLQQEKDQIVTTIVVGGTTLHMEDRSDLRDPLNFMKSSCIFSLQQNYQNQKYDQHVIIHLKLQLLDRLKFSSILSLKLIQFSMDYTQFKQALLILMKVMDNHKYLHSQSYIQLESQQSNHQESKSNFTWTDSKIMDNYFQNIDHHQLSDDDDNNIPELNFADLEQSQFNEDMQSILEESQIEDDPLQDTLKQSIFSASVFKELVNDDDDKQGLDELDEDSLIFKLKITTIRLELSNQELQNKWENELHDQDYYSLTLDTLNWNMTKAISNTATTTIKQTVIDIQQILLWDIRSGTFDQNIFQTSGEDIFYSCHFNQNNKSDHLQKFGSTYQSKKLLLHVYSGLKQRYPVVTFEDGIFTLNPLFSQIYSKTEPGIKVKIEFIKNLQSISIGNVDIQLDYQNIRDLMNLQIEYNKRKVKLPQNLNIITVHSINAGLVYEDSDIVSLYFDKGDLKILAIEIQLLQIQLTKEILISFATLSLFENIYDDNFQETQQQLIAKSIGSIKSFLKISDRATKIGLSQFEYYYNRNHAEMAQLLSLNLKPILINQQQKQQQQQLSQEQAQKIILLVDQLFLKVENRILVHIHKIGLNFKKDYQQLMIYNICVIDYGRYADMSKLDIPIYGSPLEQQQFESEQKMCFLGKKYPARQVIMYKQERFSRIGFLKQYIEDAICFEDDMSFTLTAELMENCQYMNPDDETIFLTNSNLIQLDIVNENISIKFNNGIFQVDEILLDTINYLLTQQPIMKSKQKNSEQLQIPIQIEIHNLWLNYLPTYRKSTLLKQYVMKRQAISILNPQDKEQLYYSWVRLLFRVKNARIEVAQKQLHLNCGQLYIKSTSKPAISYLNPIILIPPQFLYYVNRKITDAYQLDKDDQQYLYLLCFKKLCTIKATTIQGNNTISVGQIRGNFRMDSIVGLLDITLMTLEKFEKFTEETQRSSDDSISLPFYDIFQDDEIEFEPIQIKIESPLLQLIVKDLQVGICSGQDFPPEMFQASEMMNSQSLYFSEHTNLIQYEELPQVEDHERNRLVISIKDCDAVYNGNLKLTVDNFEILDEVINSKFCKMLGKNDNARKGFFQLSFEQNDHINLHIEINPIRICLSGNTLQYLFQLSEFQSPNNPKTSYFKNLPQMIDNHEIIEACTMEGYQVKFKKQQGEKLSIGQLIIERIQVVITFDGNGITTDGNLKRLIRMAQYDNLELNLKKAILRNMQFEKSQELQKLLVEQYIQGIKSDKKFMEQLVTQFKIFSNVTNIFLGFKGLCISVIKNGLWTGFYQGSIPLAKAVGEEIYFLAKKPIEMCEGVSEGIGLRPVAHNLFRPIGNMVDRFGNQINSNQIPKDFMRRK